MTAGTAYVHALLAVTMEIESSFCPYKSSFLIFRPEMLREQEVSVYDLRDHPDFRYRPGSVVIRVANFEECQTCSTGQVLDNFPSGEVSKRK